MFAKDPITNNPHLRSKSECEFFWDGNNYSELTQKPTTKYRYTI
jgi:hypothetical protein